MSAVSEKLIDLGGIPGFALLSTVATAAYVQLSGESADELTVVQIAMIVAVCWVADRVGARTLDPLYDAIYGAQRISVSRFGGQALADARDVAAARLFYMQQKDKNYADAVADGFVESTGPRSLYNRAKILVAPTEHWRKHIEPSLDLSKALRALVILVLASSLTLAAGRVSREIASAASSYASRLGALGTDWVLLVLAGALLAMSFALRRRHQILLYEYLAHTVAHIELHDQLGAVLVEVRFNPKDSPPHGRGLSHSGLTIGA